ncbi:MAG TPA: GNAT family N-acetyltransferase [Bacteroidia bacterium]|nr:GNAT family N-acetyltransferase [Bacteroidia bacterium]
MTKEAEISSDKIQVSFSPTINQIDEIEKWLIAERKKTGEGFYCNWNIIKSLFQKNQLAAITHNKKAIGFATWSYTSDLTARIDIVEIKPTYRNKGIGRALIMRLFHFLKERNICVVGLQCSPSNSEVVWKRLGFIDFPGNPEKYGFYIDEDKRLYTMLIPPLQPSHDHESYETIELWKDEPYRTKDIQPTYKWHIVFKNGTRELLKPIIQPGHYDWRIRWQIKDKIIVDNKVKRFGNEIDFGNFIIIKELPNL